MSIDPDDMDKIISLDSKNVFGYSPHVKSSDLNSVCYFITLMINNC